MKMRIFSFLLVIGVAGQLFAGEYDYLAKLDAKVRKPTPEHTTPKRGFRPSRPLNIELQPFYDEMEADGVLSFHLSYGAEWFSPNQIKGIFVMIQDVATKQSLPLTNFALDDANQLITFNHGDVQVRVKGDHTRESYIASYKEYDVVMYNGHSRYGRGPAFDEMQNYFRIGDEFETVEVDTRNRYFRSEPLLKLSEFPVLKATLDNIEYEYQYKGQKVESSDLPADSYTKVIEGNDKDLRQTSMLNQKQLIWLHSCSNEGHWAKSVRKVLTDPKEKLVFGTVFDAYGSAAADSLFIALVASHKTNSTEITDELNKIPSTCSSTPCYTTY